MNLKNFTLIEDRRKAVEAEKNIVLSAIGSSSVDSTQASEKNCENMIGFTQVPLGLAGPLPLLTDNRQQTTICYLPLATTEGALVASVNRGCKAIRESGGVEVYAERKGASRGPSFVVKSLAENIALGKFLSENTAEFERIAKSTSSHLHFLSYHTTMVGRQRFVRFSFDTADAMGMNMVTIATEKIALFIEEQTGAILEELSSNYCTDKKPSWQNVVLGRGYGVWAETTLSTIVIEGVLKTTPEALQEMVDAKTTGSMLSGSIGNNAQAANVIAALFLATGQDLGHVGEGSQVFITTKLNTSERNLLVSIYLPDLMVGTVGGGTTLPTQQEALRILGVNGGNSGENALQLAQIIAGAVLAGEISLLASLSEGSLVRAHERLARGKKE